MGRINNKGLYPIDTNLSLDDFVLGSDAETITSGGEKTKNYLLRGIFSTFKTSLNLASLDFCFAGGSNPDLDQTDIGYFTTNSNQTLAGAITTININKQDLNQVDITSLVTTIQGNISSFMLVLYKPSAIGQVFYFQVTNIVDNTTHYTFTVSNFVGGNSLVDETTYTLNFDLAGVPSTLTETDPIFTASPASGITAGQIANWDTAFGWGDHAAAGYQSALSGTGIVKSTAGTISYITDNSANWNTAFGWGDHAAAGYLTSFTETDPVFSASDAAAVTSVLIGQWSQAFSWGDHELAGYLTAETDPVFGASVASGITLADTQNWDSAYSWGNHNGLYLTISGGSMFGAIEMTNNSINNASGIDSSLISVGQTGVFIGEKNGDNGRRWRLQRDISTIDLEFSLQNLSSSTVGGVYSTYYKLNSSGTPTDNEDLITKEFGDTNYQPIQEIGTFTPILFGSTSGLYTISTSTGNYIKIGNLCTVFVRMSLINGSSPIGELRMGGLPFMASTPADAFGNVTMTGGSVDFYSVHCEVLSGTTELFFRYQDNLNASNSIVMSDVDFTSGVISLSVTYRTP